ncbi:hypothetical protein [Halobacteriovorax sp. JY17]|uniref:hypothetical protein n=1 Tax=Halobacteriovorax sp. JY17 TaxID=2014617 RepID=UPI000C51255B|nr:hypothetical protein [Halobacteriovorax sp. JY17]PIK15270.1 MAG: hypothetical protein CES88_00745 [Halobacteriovorax sp. JY17]
MSLNRVKYTIKKLFFSVIITVVLSYASHPSRGPQGYELVTLDYQTWLVSIPFCFIFFYFIYPKVFKYGGVTYICPSCETVKDYQLASKNEENCPECDTPMVPIEGFYDKKN